MPGNPLGRIDELAVLLGQFVIGTERIATGVSESLHRFRLNVSTKVGKLSEQTTPTTKKEEREASCPSLWS